MSNKTLDLLEQFDEGSITPKKKIQYKKPSPLFFSSKMKTIADNIHKSKFSKYRIHPFEEGKTKIYAYSELRQVSEGSKSRSLTKIRSLPRIQQISRKTKVKIFGREKKSQQMMKVCLEKIERLYCSERLKKIRREQLIKRANQNRQIAQQLLSYQQKKLLLQSITNSINLYNKSSTRLKDLCQLFSKKAQQSQTKLMILQKHKQEIKQLQSQLSSISQKIKRIQKQYNTLCEETIQSLFYTATLMQQLFVASCGKLDKRSGTLAKIQSILYERLHKRTFIIEDDKQLTDICIYLTIYMHSKSVSLNNIAILMDSLSFFSDHFRQLYCFEAFKKYSHFFIEKCLMNFEEENLDQLSESLLQRQKKYEEKKIKIVISVPEALQKAMENVLEVFKISSKQSFVIQCCSTTLDFRVTNGAQENQSEWQLRFQETMIQQQ